uniref:Solute carrier family 34 member 2a n=1 Tax=Hucho hucho TaxID=62062 RepID=A0A4W5LMN7_9TELE
MSLVSLVYMLQKLFRGSAQKTIRKALDFNGYVNIFLGTLITFCVHSSTVVTSTLTPMAGLGLITLEQVYPIVIGANLGTTVTALLASWVTGSPDAVAIALVHFWFNIWGIFLFYPIPITRKPILDWARRLAFYSARWPMVAGLFLLLLFLIVPGIAMSIPIVCLNFIYSVLSSLLFLIDRLFFLSCRSSLQWRVRRKHCFCPSQTAVSTQTLFTKPMQRSILVCIGIES